MKAVGGVAGAFVALGFCLSGFGGRLEAGEQGDLVRVEAQVYETKSDGSRRTISEPTFVVPLDEWASFRDGGTLRVPTEYSQSSIPQELGASARLQGEGSFERKWETNPKGLVIPPHPSKFEERRHGLEIRFRPRAAAGGRVTVDCEWKHTVFEGFVNRGRAIVVDRARLGGKEKEVVVADNRFQEPRFVTRSGTLRFLPGESGNAPETISESVQPEGSGSASGKIEVSLRAERIEAGKTQPKERPRFRKPAVYVTTRAIEVSGDVAETLPEAISLEGAVLSDPEFQVFIRALNQKKGVDLLSAPSLLTYPGKPARIEVMKEFIYPLEYDAPDIRSASGTEDSSVGFAATPATPIEFETTGTGVSVEVTPRILSDGRLELVVKPRTKEFESFINFGRPIVKIDPVRLGKRQEVVVSDNRIEMPRFLEREMETTVRIADGQTVLIGGLVREDIQEVEDKVPVLGDLPLIGQLARSETEIHVRRHLFFAIRAQLLEAEGQ